MEEILHHLGCKRPVNNGINYLINWCRISSIHSITAHRPYRPYQWSPTVRLLGFSRFFTQPRPLQDKARKPWQFKKREVKKARIRFVSRLLWPIYIYILLSIKYPVRITLTYSFWGLLGWHREIEILFPKYAELVWTYALIHPRRKFSKRAVASSPSCFSTLFWEGKPCQVCILYIHLQMFWNVKSSSCLIQV